MRGPRVVAALVVLAMGPASGCSWIFVTRAPEPPVPSEPPVNCTTSVASPVVDTVAAALLAASGVALIVSGAYAVPPCSAPDWCFGQDLARGFATGFTVTGGVMLASAIPLAFSAGYGYATTADCRGVREAQLACVSGVETSCAGVRSVGP